MNRFHTLYSIVLALIIGLGSVTAVAHSHDDHQDTSCSVSVLQKSSAAVASQSSTIFVTNATTPYTIRISKAKSSRIRSCQLARAPPLNL